MCQSGWSSLIIASCNGHVELVEKLLQHGATVDLLHEVLVSTITFLSINVLFLTITDSEYSIDNGLY